MLAMHPTANTPDGPELTPLGLALDHARIRRGMSVRDLTDQAGISDTTWRHLVRGYKVVAGQRVPYSPRPDNVVNVARAVGYPVDEALSLAGYTRRDLDPELRATLSNESEIDLSTVPTVDLLAELARRLNIPITTDTTDRSLQIEKYPERSSVQTADSVVNVSPTASIAFLPPGASGGQAETDHSDGPDE